MYFLIIEKIVNFGEVRKLTPLHVKWTQERVKEGRIVLTGRWGESGGGMVIMKADNIHEAKQILNEEPMIKAGCVSYEIDVFIEMYKNVITNDMDKKQLETFLDNQGYTTKEVKKIISEFK